MKWEDFPVTEDDAPCPGNCDDEMHTAIAQALLGRKVPTTYVGPYIPPDEKYLVTRDRDRTQNENVLITALRADVKIGHSVQAPSPNCVGVSWLGAIDPAGSFTDWTLGQEYTL